MSVHIKGTQLFSVGNEVPIDKIFDGNGPGLSIRGGEFNSGGDIYLGGGDKVVEIFNHPNGMTWRIGDQHIRLSQVRVTRLGDGKDVISLIPKPENARGKLCSSEYALVATGYNENGEITSQITARWSPNREARR